MNLQLRNIAAAIASACAISPVNAALMLDNIPGGFFPGGSIAAPYVAYDDARSYSLPVLGILYNIGQTPTGGTPTFGNSITPSNPYYVQSGVGQLADLVVLGTGSNNQGVNINFSGMDNAYATPNNNGGDFFSTGSESDPESGPYSPGGDSTPNPSFAGDLASTWDARLDSFASFLNGGSAVFLFNNNDTNSDDGINQSLAAWMAITLIDEQDASRTKTLFFRNRADGDGALPGEYALVSEGGGGVLNGAVGNGTAGVAGNPVAGTNDSTDYVLSGGALCYDAALTIVSCGSASAVGGPINHNLGANQAAYAVVFDELDRILALSNFDGYDVMNIDFRFGCDPDTINPERNCRDRIIDNGFEQLFVMSNPRNRDQPVPEPGALALTGIALAGVYLVRRRRRV